MTVIVGIVGKTGVLIAGDAQSSSDWIKREDVSAKVFTLMDTVAFGYCGSGRFGQILQYHLDHLDEPPLGMDEHRWVVRDFIPYLRDVTHDHGHLHVKHENQVEEFGESAFLLAVRGRLFCVESDFSVNEHILPYESIGSGAETAMGHLHGVYGDTTEPVEDKERIKVAEKAIQAASRLTLYVGGDISWVETVRFTRDEVDLAKEMLDT